MRIKRSETPEGKIELQITAPADKVSEAIRFMEFQLAYQNGIDIQNTKDLTFAVIAKVGEAYYHSFLDFEVMRYLAPFAVTQEKLAIIGNPQVESTGKNIEPGKELSFRAVVIPKPIYEIEDYSPVKIRVPKPEISEADIDRQLLKMAEEYTKYEKDEDHPVQDGNDILFGIKTCDSKGEEITQLSAERRAYTVGQNYIPGGFDAQLTGMDVGETKTFDITSKDFLRVESEDPEATETYTFTVTILEIQKRVIPAITDSWVEKNIPNLSTVPELREEIRKQGLLYREQELGNMKSYLAASEFARRFKGSIADELYELTREDIMSNMQQALQAQGKSLRDFIQEQGGGDQQFSMQLMMQTREVLTQGFSLDALARHLKLEVTDQDIEDTFHAMAPGYERQARMEFEMTGRMYQIEEGALRNKANKWLVENAEIEYISE
ncbi:MAG: hypothetical protein FWF91_03285 [Coriobacteriia bacterium]|nr:hypothetical protein [Coriobacteriia bacterium]